MKRFVVAVLALMLIFTEVLSPVQVNALEKATQCEEKAFTVEPFIVGDEKLEGKGHPGEEIDLQFKDMETIIEMDKEGRFEYIWEEETPEVGDTIILTNTPYEIELTVEAEILEHEKVEAELVDACEPAVSSEEVEGTEAEDSVKEEVTEEASGKSSEADEKEAPERSIEEPSPDEEAGPKEDSDEVPEEGGSEEAGLVEEPVVEASDETVPEKDETAEETVSSEEPVEEKAEEMESIEAAPKEEELEVEEKEEVKSEGDADKETDIAKEEVANQHERTEEVDSIEEASEEESEEETEEVLKEESVEAENRMVRSSMAVVQGFSIESEVPINTVIGSTVRVNNAAEFNDALSSIDVEVIILEADIHITSPQTVQSESGQKVIEGKGYIIDIGRDSLLIGSSVTEMVVKGANLRTANIQKDNGFFRKMETHMNLRLENITFNNNQSPSLGMFGSSWESDVHFYGDNNVINTNNDFYSMAFRRIIIHERAELELNHHSSNPAFMFNTDETSSGEYGFRVEESGSLTVKANGPVMKTNLSPGTSINFEVDQGKKVSLIGSGSVIFDLDTEMNFSVNSPKNVEIINERANTRLFKRWNDVTFSMKNTKLSAWHLENKEDKASAISPIIKKGTFTFTTYWVLWPLLRGERTVRGEMIPNIDARKFEEDFPPDMRRMIFERGIIQSLKIDDILDTHNKISGTTVPGAEVTIYDDLNNVITSTQAGNEGDFTFNLDDRFDAGTVLRFDARLDNAASETVEKTVIGNRLEFGHVPTSIPFNTTEIKDEEMKIYRQNDNPGIEIVETREDRDWKLSVEATSPLTNENEKQDTLENAFYYFSEGNEPKRIEETPALVACGTTSETIEWARDEGILLKLNPIRAAANTEYKATIEWTLSDGP